MPLSLFPYPIAFTKRDWIPRPLEELAVELRVSRAFIRLCAEAGCPDQEGRRSVVGLLVWLFEHYEAVRALAGLPPLAPLAPSSSPAMKRLKMVHGILTLLEYGRSRATNWRQKRQLRQAAEALSRESEPQP